LNGVKFLLKKYECDFSTIDIKVEDFSHIGGLVGASTLSGLAWRIAA